MAKADQPTLNDPGTPKPRVKPNPRVDVDPIFEKQIKELQKQATEESTKAVTGDQVKWMMPDKNGWDGDLFNWKDMGKPFDRSKSNQAFSESIKDPKNPGTTGDGVVAILQVDYLATMERAFRSRHTMSRARALSQAMGRKDGHGNDKGPLVQTLEYVRGLVKLSKDAPT